MNKACSRRDFIKRAGYLFMAPGMLSVAGTNRSPLNILVLGGTYFLGPAIVQQLLELGHRITLFNRGKTNPHLFPDVPKLRGDREQGPSGYSAIPKDQHWDVVVDVWPQNPQLVEEAILAVKDRCAHYIYISSIAAYRDYRTVGITEDHPLVPGNEYEKDNYSLNKVLCEKVVAKHFPGQFTVLRPGAIIGERDPGPFTHHLIRRFLEQSEILAPDAEDPVQIIDAWDIGSFVGKCADNKLVGYYNLVGPATTLSYRKLLLELKRKLPGRTKIRWIDPKFLTEKMEVEPFVDIPFWIPLAGDPEPGFYQIDNQKAIRAGLQFSPLSDTIKRAYRSLRAGHTASDNYLNGISTERETAILTAWKQQEQHQRR